MFFFFHSYFCFRIFCLSFCLFLRTFSAIEIPKEKNLNTCKSAQFSLDSIYRLCALSKKINKKNKILPTWKHRNLSPNCIPFVWNKKKLLAKAMAAKPTEPFNVSLQSYYLKEMSSQANHLLFNIRVTTLFEESFVLTKVIKIWHRCRIWK